MEGIMREVPSQEWGSFCQKLNQFEGGAMVTLELTAEDGESHDVARNVIFDRMDFGKRDDCSDRISIRSRDSKEHEIVEPIHVLLKETEGGAAFQSVTIQAESGITKLTFQPVIRASWLQDLPLR
jgi:hypothetical protein